MRFTLTASALALLVIAPIAGQTTSPVGDEQTRWWAHVTTLADDRLEGRQTGTDGYRKAAAYVVEQFERAGLKAAGTRGYLQPVQFTQRRILEDQSRLALVRDGKEDVLRFGDDTGVNLRAELTPSVEAPLVFVGASTSRARSRSTSLVHPPTSLARLRRTISSQACAGRR